MEVMANFLQIIKRLQELSPKEMIVQALEDRVEIGPQNPAEQANTTINRVLISSYPSARVVTKASQEKSNLLITYRPLFPFAVDRLSGLDLVRVRLAVGDGQALEPLQLQEVEKSEDVLDLMLAEDRRHARPGG